MSDTMRKILDDAKEQLISSPDEVGCIISNITRQLFLCKQELDRKQWQVFMEDCRQHNIISLLHQDPMTARAYAQPRGYQGDAELIDIIYSMNYKQYTNINATTLGDKIFRHTILCKAPSAVRLRRDFLTEQLNDICSKQSNAQILSIACGHLREALVSSAILNRKFSRFIGLDQDNTSLNTVNMTLGNLGVETIQMSIIDLLLHESIEEKFNYIYAAGLYDYLSIRQCKRLTKRLFDMLLPGGRLLIANFLQENDESGYMEVYQDWHLTYRSNEEMHLFIENIPYGYIDHYKVYADPLSMIAYIDIYKL